MYELAAPQTPVLVKCFDMYSSVSEMEIDSDSQAVVFHTGEEDGLTLSDILAIDPDALSEILEYDVVAIVDGEPIDANDVYGEEAAGIEALVIFA